jgi:DNA-directed RNA polymerase specialized sigma24 family protein
VKPATSLQLTDAMLMAEVQAGRRGALGELYERFAVRAYRVAFSVCRDRECAEDAVQDAFLSMWSARAGCSLSRISPARAAASARRRAR